MHRKARSVRRRGRGAVAVAAALALLAACGGGDDDEARDPDAAPPEPTRGGSLVVGTSGEVDGFNPATSQWSGPAYIIARAVLDPLVVLDAEGDWHPYLAESITPSDDFTTWTVTLRDGVEFHNGEALDADALVQFLELVTTSPLSSQAFPSAPELEATDASTVTMTFDQPWATMPYALVEQAGYVIAPEQIESGDAERPIGTGPFVFDEWERDVHFRATRNDAYWRDGLPYVDEVTFQPITDQTSRIAALRSGDVDLIDTYSMRGDLGDELVEDGFAVHDAAHAGVKMVLMNTERPGTDDERVRRAVATAIDREEFARTVAGDPAEAADQPFRPESRWYAEVDYPEFDPDAARALVEEYEAEEGDVALTMIAVTGDVTPTQFVVQALDEVGIEVDLQLLELASFINRFVGGDYDAVFLGSFFGAEDPDGSHPFLRTPSPESLINLNFARYANPEVEAALDAQRATDDVTERQAEWATVWQILADDLPYAYLAYERIAFVVRPEVFGIADFTTPEGVAIPPAGRWATFVTGAYREASD